MNSTASTRTHAPPALAQKILPVFLMRVGLFWGAGRFQGSAHWLQAVADGTGFMGGGDDAIGPGSKGEAGTFEHDFGNGALFH